MQRQALADTGYFPLGTDVAVRGSAFQTTRSAVFRLRAHPGRAASPKTSGWSLTASNSVLLAPRARGRRVVHPFPLIGCHRFAAWQVCDVEHLIAALDL
jgi:hypothetical protein